MRRIFIRRAVGIGSLKRCQVAARPVVILSNNTAEAIGTYLDRHQLRGQVLAVVGRRFGQPKLMKPHPALVEEALAVVGAPAPACAFTGDSLTDLEAAQATGLQFIGYGKTRRRIQELREAGAVAIVDQMSDLTAAVHAIHALH